MQDYKNTLLMPSTSFEMKADLKTKEPTLQNWWLSNEIYRKTLLKNEKLPYFTLHDGPPYANGNIHVGHALNKILKDIIVRHKSMSGFNAVYIPGWDTHGLPIENAIAKKDKNFEINLSVSDKRSQCRQYALEQVEIQKEQFKRLGLATDFKDIYKTLDETFVLDELNLFKTLVEKNLVFQDFKPVYWSWSTKCALADAEIEYANVTSPSVYIAFELVDAPKTKIIIWTTTPWTIPSNLATAANPDLEYSYVKVQDETFIVASNLVEKIATELSWESYTVDKKVKGTELENIKYRHPWIDRVSPIILAEYVSAEDGTGLVHNAPGFGLDDYYACRKYGIDVYCPINDFGKFDASINDPELENVFYTKANDIILERLTNSGNLLKKTDLVHSVAHDWRTHKPVMYRATKQWFINIGKASNIICGSLESDVSSLSSKTIERIKEMISKRQEWCISRQRVWGVPIPMIFDENHDAIFDVKLVEHIVSIIEKEGVDIWFEKDVEYFIPEWMDKTKTYFKEKDIIDVWFDSGSSYNVLKRFNLPYPADMYLEGTDQFRGWFNSSAINGAIQHGKVPYKFLLQHGFTLDEKGFKMSKSKGNVIDPLKVCGEHGADILRLWVASAEYSTDQRFGNSIIKQVSETYRKIRNTLFRYTLSNLNDFDASKDFQQTLRVEDNYILNQLKINLENINKAFNGYNFIEVVKIVTNFTNQLSQWYFDLIKDELYCGNQNSVDRRCIQTTLFIIVKSLIIALTPIIPHTCEEAYQTLQFNGKLESVALENFPTIDKEFNLDSFKVIDTFFGIKDKVYLELEKARQESVLKKNNEAIVTMPKIESISETTLAKWLNVAAVNFTTDEITVKNASFNKCQRCWNHFDNANMHNDEICSRCNDVLNKN
ncbi:MAG: isoleucine--tRNA ligase [Mycoplasma sp.]